jgi:outer membrane protein assembly factor BamE
MRLSAIFLSFLIISTSACSWIKFPSIHKVAIQQGNVVTQEMIDKLQLNMTKPQVQFTLGTPLIIDTFEQTRWEYFFSYVDSNGQKTQRQVTLFFDNEGKLSRVSGDYLPEFEQQSN